MKIDYRVWHSDRLGRDMEYKVYGHGGKLLIYFPTQWNRFFEAEDKGVVATLSGPIEEGRLTLVAVDSIDGESLCNYGYWDKRKRLELQEAYFNYFYHELLPSLEHDYPHEGLPYLLGMSFGAYQAMAFYLRVPDRFDGVFAFSGIYDIRYFFSDYFDDLALLNSPIDLAYTMGDPYQIECLRNKKMLVVVSYGAYESECVDNTRRLEEILHSKGIHKQFYYWSHEFPHDFPSWNHYLYHYIWEIL